LTPKKTILVICHDSNTFDKMKMREEQRAQAMHPSAMRESSFTLEHWVKDPSLREFYYNLKHRNKE